MSRLISFPMVLVLAASVAAIGCGGVDYDNPTFEDIPVLINQWISSHDWRTPDRATEALALVCSQEGGVEAIVELLKDDDPQLRKETTIFLGYAIWQGLIPHEAEPLLIPSLLEALEDESEEVRRVACNVLSTLARSRTSDAEDLPTGGFSEVVRAVASVLDDDHWRVRYAAARALPDFGQDALEAIPALKLTLEDSEIAVRFRAATAIAKIAPDDTDEVMRVLIETVESEGYLNDGFYRREAADALGLLGPNAIDAIPALLRAMRSWNRRVRIAAGRAIAQIRPPAEMVVPDLIELLRDEDPGIREHATIALRLLGPAAKDALPVLTEMLGDPVREVRGQVRAAIASIEADNGENDDAEIANEAE